MSEIEQNQLERLKKYDDMTARILQEREAVMEEMKELRDRKKTRSLRYKECLSRKMVNQRMIDLLEEFGIV